MRTSFAAGAALMLVAGFAAAADLSIPAGRVYTIEPAQSDLRLDRLEIGDNATVRFAPGVSRWKVDAARVVIGRDVTIDGRGAVAGAGGPGADQGGKAKECSAGLAGGAGGAGGDGGDGVALLLRWGVASLGSVKLLTDGGAGGSGGPGGKGQHGGEYNNCSAPAAGAGGEGGRGGRGGAGGDVTLTYFDAGGGQDLFALRDRITVSAKGGSGGGGGSGGEGGTGTDGKFELTSTPMGRKWLAGGKAGANGAAGAVGTTGVAGEVRLQEALAAAPAAARPTAPAAAAAVTPASAPVEDSAALLRELQRRVQALEEQVEALQRR